MMYILWSIHTGIICGCQLYEVAVLTSLVVTIVLLVMEHLPFSRKSYILVLNMEENAEDEIRSILKESAKSFTVKSRNYSENDYNIAVELSVKEQEAKKKRYNWIIAITVAVLYLTVSLLTGKWQWTWIIWFVYCFYRILTEYMMKR